jgi:hypothetical protein
MNEKKEAFTFRHRGFKMPDGSITMVFGNDPEPVDGFKMWDHKVTQQVVVEDWSEPVV